MKKKFAMLCIALVVGFAGTAFAARPPKAPKVMVCHNGGVYNGDVTVGTSYDVDAWVPGSFVINISANAVPAHLNNHGDCLASAATVAGVAVTEVSTAAVLDEQTGEVVDVVVTGSGVQPACTCLPQE